MAKRGKYHKASAFAFDGLDHRGVCTSGGNTIRQGNSRCYHEMCQYKTRRQWFFVCRLPIGG